MNISKIEENIKNLLKMFSKETFIYDLLSAYGKPKASINRLKSGSYNLSKIPGEIIWRKVLFLKETTPENLHSVYEAIKKDEVISKQKPRFIIVTDYQTLLAFDTKTGDSLTTNFESFSKHFEFFLPWAGLEKSKVYTENPADVKAAEKMAKLYDAICKDSPNMTPESYDSLNVFLSRLLFCFFAEDTEIFSKNLFTNSVKSYTREDGNDLNEFLDKVFLVMNQEERKSYPTYLQDFPYVNGGLFAKSSSIRG